MPRLFAALSLMLTCAACAHGDLRPQPSPEQLSTPAGVDRATATRVTRECKKLTGAVAHPRHAAGRETIDAGVAEKRALDLANDKLAATGVCIDRVADGFAVGAAE